MNRRLLQMPVLLGALLALAPALEYSSARAPRGARPAPAPLGASPPGIPQRPAGAATALSKAVQGDSQSLLAGADEVFTEMSRITDLPIRAPLKKQMISRAEVRKHLEESLHADLPPAELRIQEATLRAFGLVSRDFNLENFLLDFYTEQAAGFYDPRRKTMFIADWVTPEMQDMVLAHELTHALQDQNFDLEKFLHASRPDDDATDAREAVVEGHATAAMMQRLVEPMDLAELPSLQAMMAGVVHQQFEEFPAYSTAPFFFRMQALFPYLQGVGFMQRGLSRGGWKKLNLVFAHPPPATKEIFEPELYFDAKPLPKIELPRPQPLSNLSGLRLLSENILGELGYYSVLGQLISENEAQTTATAWLADRYILYEGPGPRQYALVGRTRWTSSEAALAFFRDVRSILAVQYPELTPDARSGADLYIGAVASGRVVVLRKGDECLFAEGVPAAQTDAMLDWLRSL